MNDDVQPADAVGDAGDAAAEATTEHAAAEGIDAGETDGMGSSSTLREMLFSTEPSPSLDTVESPFDPDAGGMNRVYRGFQKMTGVDGMPAVVDLAIGVAEWVTGSDLADNFDDTDESNDDGDGGDVVVDPDGEGV